MGAAGATDPEIREVADELPDYAYTTVATVLDRLAQKGLVQREMDGRTVRFVAVGSRGAHTAVQMHEALAVDRDPGAALARFAAMLTRSEAEDLGRALERSKQDRQ